MSRSNVFSLCVYYVIVYYLACSIIALSLRFGFIQVDGEYVGVFGAAVHTVLNWMGEVDLPVKILKFDAIFTATTLVFIFGLGGITRSLPRSVKMKEPFSVVSLGLRDYNIEEYLSKASKFGLWVSGLFVVKSFVSASAVLLAIGTFSVYYKWSDHKYNIEILWFFGLSLTGFGTSIGALAGLMHTLRALSGGKFILNHDLWMVFPGLLLKLTRRKRNLRPRISARYIHILRKVPSRLRW